MICFFALLPKPPHMKTASTFSLKGHRVTKEKLQFAQTQVWYIGHWIAEQELQRYSDGLHGVLSFPVLAITSSMAKVLLEKIILTWEAPLKPHNDQGTYFPGQMLCRVYAIWPVLHLRIKFELHVCIINSAWLLLLENEMKRFQPIWLSQLF